MKNRHDYDLSDYNRQPEWMDYPAPGLSAKILGILAFCGVVMLAFLYYICRYICRYIWP